MDDGKGELVPFKTEEELAKLQRENPLHGGWFRVGEEVVLKGSRFRVKAVKPTELRLKLLKRKPKAIEQQSLKEELEAIRRSRE